jgi:outer membrane protein assembly factor BamB
MLKTRQSLTAGLILAATLIQTCNAVAADWPQWRGAARNDLSKEAGLLKAWPEGGPALTWKATGLGAGYSGIAVVGDRIYTVGDKEGSACLLALNAADGKVVWSTPFGKAGAPGWGGFTGPRCTPTVEGDRVYGLAQFGDIVCAQIADGKKVWSKHMVDDLGGVLPEWGFSESALVDGAQVVFTPGGSKGTLAALNKATGEVVWRTQDWTDATHYSSIILEEIGGVRQYIQLTAASVAGVSPKDGKVLWKAARKGATAVIPTPIYADNHVYVTSGYGIGCNLFKVTESGGTFQATQVYANKVMVNHHGGVIKVGDHLYGHSEGKGWTCQNFKTGEATWAEKDKLKKGAVAYADGMLYCREEDSGTVALLEASPTGYNEKGRFKQPERAKEKAWTHPVVCNGKLYLRDQDLLFCYDVKAK